MSKKRVYLSHAIRGQKGSKATDKEIEENCKGAIRVVNLLRNQNPDYEFYCPAEVDEFPNTAFKRGLLTVQEILDIDCSIIAKRDVLYVYAPNGRISKGMQQEIDAAIALNIKIKFIWNYIK